MQHEKILHEKQQLEKKISAIQKQLEALPQGKLLCAGNNGYVKWYHSDGHTNTYISKKDRQLAEKLATKKYLTLLEKDLQKEKKALESYLKYHQSDYGLADQLLTEPSEYQKLLSPYFQSISAELLNWQNSPYPRKEEYPDELNIKAPSGNMVRSKSEALIDMFLYKNKIPFRYECELILGNQIYYPDFTIRHPFTGKVFYWEHFGLMDDRGYVKKTRNKIYEYSIHGIIPSIQLITTYETQENPLTVETVEKTIEFYFGNTF